MINKLNKLNTKQLAAGVAGVAVLVLAVWYMALIRPQDHKLTAAHAALSAADQQIGTLHGQVSQLLVYKSERASDAAKLAALEQAIPADPELASAIRQIDAAAAAAAVSISSLDPQLSAPGATATSSSTVGGAQVLPVQIACSGSYPALLGFIHDLATMPRTVVVDTVNLSSGSSGALTASLSADLFYLDASSTDS